MINNLTFISTSAPNISNLLEYDRTYDLVFEGVGYGLISLLFIILNYNIIKQCIKKRKDKE
ncbi:hypothetical protein CPAV1605_1135 [seawater metagenome]|uniref:Uncharacterized protein n=1 Tax=seawater metagenome TaxID=1561972 RepID=A0A5E8CKV2_9ZZZZ